MICAAAADPGVGLLVSAIHNVLTGRPPIGDGCSAAALNLVMTVDVENKYLIKGKDLIMNTGAHSFALG